MKKLIAMVLALAMVLSLAACGEKTKPTDAPKETHVPKATDAPKATEAPKETEAPAPEIKGEINIYTTFSDDAILALEDYVADIYPDLTINMVKMNGGEMANRIMAEKDNPQGDFVCGASCETYIQMGDYGVLDVYQPKGTEDWPDIAHSPKWYWFSTHYSYLGFYCDQEWFAAQGIDIPDSWEDLLDPRLKGQIIVTNPGTSTTGYMVLSALIHLMGEEEALEYYGKLHENVKNYASGGSGPSQSVALGEAPVGIGYMQHGMQLIKQGYTNMVISAPSEGTGLEVCAGAVIKGAKNLAAAQAIADILASKEWHEYAAETYAVGLMYPDGVPCQGLENFTDTKIIDIDYVWAADNKDRILPLWSSITGN